MGDRWAAKKNVRAGLKLYQPRIEQSVGAVGVDKFGQWLCSPLCYSLREKYSDFATPNLRATRQPVFGIIILKTIDTEFSPELVT